MAIRSCRFLLRTLLAMFAFINLTASTGLRNRIVVQENHQTDLPCITEHPVFNRTNNVLKVSWFHQKPGRSATTPFYTVDLNASNQVTRWSAEQWNTRAYFNLLSYPFSLKLIRLAHFDAGNFICQVQFKDGTTRNGTVQLQVVVPPSPPTIQLESGEDVPSVFGPLNETSKLSLVCKVKGGKPTPSVTWKLLGGDLEGNVRTTRSGDLTTSWLTLNPLRREHHDADFICESANDDTVYHTARVRLQLNLAPLLVQIRRSDTALSSGYDAEIICEVWGSVPPAKVSWWKNGVNLEQDFEHTSMDGNLTTSVVRFRPRAEDNGQSLVCRAENPHMSVLGVREDQWDLNVHYRPQIRIQLESPGEGSINEGSDISIACMVDANPAPFGPLVWKHNDHKLTSSSGSGITARRNRLHIRNIRHAHAGNYTCEISNNQGQGISSALYLRIKHVPVCKPHQQVVYHTRVGEPVFVSCSVSSHPSSVSFRWKVNSTSNVARIARATWDGTTSVAEFTPRESGDFGTLLCWARNQIGDQKEPCTFIIADAGSPWLADELTIATSLCVALLLMIILTLIIILRRRRRESNYIQEACGSGHPASVPKNGCNNNQFNDAAYLT